MKGATSKVPVLVRLAQSFRHRPTFLFSLRWRLSLVLGAVILLCTTAGVLLAVIFLQSTLTDRATSDLQHTLGGASVYLDHEQNRLLNAAELISGDPEVSSSLRNRVALINKLTPYVNSLNVDILDVVDRHGRVVVRMEATSSFGYSITSIRGVSQALSGDGWTGLARDPADGATANGWGMRAAAPLQSGPNIVGAVVVGRLLDSAFAGELGSIFNADVNVIVGNRRTGSTEQNVHGVAMVGTIEPRSLLKRMATGQITTARVQEEGQPVLSGLVPLNDANGNAAGAIEFVRPLNPVYSIVNRLSLLLLATGVLIVISGALLALYLLRRVTRRLLSLETMASEVATHAEGDAPLHNLRQELPVHGRDEVASLARSIDSMMLALDNRLNTIEQLYATSQARVNELTGLADVARLLTAERPIDETLATLSEHICRLVHCEAAAIYVPANERTSAVFGSHGLPDGHVGLISSAFVRQTEEDAPHALLAAYWSGKPAWRPVDIMVDQSGDGTTLDVFAHGGATAVPLRLQDRSIGVLVCYTRIASPLPPSDMHLLTTVADQVAVAVENARLYAQAREVATMEERARLARELHDSVTQALFSMTLHTRAAQLMLDRQESTTREPLDRALHELGELARAALAEMRALIFELRPGALSEEGLVAALRKQAAAVSAREGLRVDVQVPSDSLTLDVAGEEHLYRVSQEALHNAVKHARATEVRIRLWSEGETVLVEVADDGVGFDTAAVPPGHLGLRTMAERMAQIGGTVEIASAPGHGTTVRAAYRSRQSPQPGPDTFPVIPGVFGHSPLDESPESGNER